MKKLKFYIPSKYAKYTIFRHKITQFLALTNNPLGRSLCYKFRSILSQKPHTYFSRENSSIVCWKLSGNYIFSLDEPCDIHLQLQSYCIAWCTRLGLRWKYIFVVVNHDIICYSHPSLLIKYSDLSGDGYMNRKREMWH